MVPFPIQIDIAHLGDAQAVAQRARHFAKKSSHFVIGLEIIFVIGKGKFGLLER